MDTAAMFAEMMDTLTTEKQNLSIIADRTITKIKGLIYDDAISLQQKEFKSASVSV